MQYELLCIAAHCNAWLVATLQKLNCFGAVVQKGQVYNASDGQRALRDVFAMGIFDSMQILPNADQRDPSKINVDVMVSERPRRTADLDCSWSIAPNDAGRPSLASIIPGAGLAFPPPFLLLHRHFDQVVIWTLAVESVVTACTEAHAVCLRLCLVHLAAMQAFCIIAQL